MIYDKSFIDEVVNNIDLVEYVSETMELKKKGNKDYFCSCPLHIDKTPSLSFNKNTNLWYCFSCGKGGNIINYLMHYEKMTFNEAINKAMRLSGVDGDKICKSNSIIFLKNAKYSKTKEEEKVIHNILDKEIYKKYSKEPILLWEQEGISSEVMDLFEIRIDKNANRIVYPVYDINGNFINVKGRTLYPNYKDLDLPKYMNYYPIGTMDYFQGYNITKPYIKESNEVIIFESVKSVMKAFQWGYKNCLSAEKHTLTNEQIKFLLKLHKDIIFAFDTDVDYNSKELKTTIDKLKRMTNVYVATDIKKLGGRESKNSPVDCGKEIWENIYENKVKLI